MRVDGVLSLWNLLDSADIRVYSGNSLYGITSINHDGTYMNTLVICDNADAMLKCEGIAWFTKKAFFNEKVKFDNGADWSSDARIKKNIIEINDDLSLKKVRDISCCSYNYIDSETRGDALQVGFIAQQVRTVFPQAVKIRNDYIANENRLLYNITWTENIMTTNKLQDVSGIKYIFYVSGQLDESDTKFNKKVDISGAKTPVKIQKTEENVFEVIGNENDGFVFEKRWKYIYCYGKASDNLLVLDENNEFILDESRKLNDAVWSGHKMTTPDLKDISGTRYRFYVKDKNDEEEKMIDTICDKNNAFKFDKKWNIVKCYGKEVDDFHNIDKAKIFALNFSATQEIDRIQQAERKKVSILEAKVASLEERLLAIENKLNT
jgi:hypothetical protein